MNISAPSYRVYKMWIQGMKQVMAAVLVVIVGFAGNRRVYTSRTRVRLGREGDYPDVQLVSSFYIFSNPKFK